MTGQSGWVAAEDQQRPEQDVLAVENELGRLRAVWPATTGRKQCAASGGGGYEVRRTGLVLGGPMEVAAAV